MRTDYLVHWTGKDICSDIEKITDSERLEYVKRLFDILNKGFWMTTPLEKVIGANGAWIEYGCSMTCFTEARLSQAYDHARKYGFLGIGVRRKFVLERYGAPVFYLRNHSNESIVGNAQAVLNAINKYVPESEKGDILNYYGMICAFMKGMSGELKDDYVYLEEQEWRVIHSFQAEGKFIDSTGRSMPKYRLKVSRGDWEFIVFPDAKTREIAKSDEANKFLLQQCALLTVEETRHF